MKTTATLCLVRVMGGLIATLIFEALANAEPSRTPATTAAEAPLSTDEVEAARELFVRGEAAFRAKQPELARSYFLKVWEIRRTYDVASALGQTETTLGLARDAAEHFDFAIRNYPPQMDPADLTRTKEALARAKREVGTVTVTVDRSAAEVLLDGRVVGRAPLVAPLFLTPGQHTIEVREGRNHVSRSVTVTAGSEPDLTLTLGGAHQLPSADALPQQRRVSPIPLFIGGGVVLGAAGIGIGYAIAAGSAHDRADTLHAQLPVGACADDSPQCAQLRTAAEDHNRDRLISSVALGVSAAALVATATYYWVVTRPKSVRLGGAVTNTAAALSLSGAW